ncbi:MAG TPA: class F sortase [Streptosporangiaceae bacterium]|jgi:sortase (surface protein transpeptidase)|nr:class F sortase [Streptosporangiaceae bacterium]
MPRPDNSGGGGRHISPYRVIRRPAAVAALLIGLLVAGAGLTGLAVASQTGRPATPVSKATLAPIPRGKWAAAPPARVRAVARPVRLYIPAIGVRTRLIRLGLTATGALQVPPTTSVAGWYTGSPRPGEPGGAVIAGHIDSVAGPGVFFRLRLLHRGERVFVRQASGRLAVFRVTGVRSYLKSRFPTGAVYGPAPNAQLRLITCGGTFDVATGHYLSNTIVYASLVS